MNIIWLLIVLVTILYCLATGNVGIINDVFLNVGKETFDFVIPLLCVTCFWNGILYIARDAGIIHGLERLFHPLLKRLFPDLKDDEETLGYVATNVVVNMVGLGSAATPVGLQAMKGMQRHNPDKDTASRSMITFLVFEHGWCYPAVHDTDCHAGLLPLPECDRLYALCHCIDAVCLCYRSEY